MKTLRILFLALGLFGMIGFTTSCDSNTSAEEKMEEAGDDISDAFRTEREELQADLREARQDIDEKLTELRADLEEASDDAKKEINDKIAKLEKWGNEIDRDMDRVAQSAENGWANLKGNIRESLDEMENAWDDAFNS